MVASHTPQLGSWPETQACALTGNQTGNPLVCRPALNPLSYTSQAKIISFVDFRERKRRDQSIVPLIDAFIDCFLYVPRLGIEPTALVYQDGTLTN